MMGDFSDWCWDVVPFFLSFNREGWLTEHSFPEWNNTVPSGCSSSEATGVGP